jgi:cob(I)alamin adenosyltransferase
VRIYTKTGDSGETSLFDKSRVLKSHPRVEAYGDVDELNACLGAARAAGADPDLDAVLETIQRQLFAVGARLADPAARIAARVEKAIVQSADVERLENWIDSFEQALPPCASSSCRAAACAARGCTCRVRYAGGPNGR